MDVLVLIDKLDDLVHNAKPVPLTDQVRVDKEEIYDILDQMRATIPEEIKQARWIVKERQEMLAEAVSAPRTTRTRSSTRSRSTSRSSSPPSSAGASDCRARKRRTRAPKSPDRRRRSIHGVTAAARPARRPSG
jgi:hypothetical protein